MLLADDACRLIAQACRLQLREHVAPTWERVAPEVDFVSRTSSPCPGSLLIYVDDDPDVNGTFGYHTGPGAGHVFVRPILTHGGGVLTGALSVAAVVSHEATEAFIDPTCRTWTRRDDGSLVAREACDPVNEQAYAVAVGDVLVSVSDFVTPAWFDPTSDGPHDWMRTLSGSFSLGTGGYCVTLGAGPPAEEGSTRLEGARPRVRSSRRHLLG